MPGCGIARSNMGEVRVDLSRATLCLGECLTLRSAQPILIKGIDPDRHVQAEFPCQVAHPGPRAGHLHSRRWPCPGRQPFLLTKGTERVVGFAAADERNMALPRDDTAGSKINQARRLIPTDAAVYPVRWRNAKPFGEQTGKIGVGPTDDVDHV